jgi:hypothetical protein
MNLISQAFSENFDNIKKGALIHKGIRGRKRHKRES